MALIVENGTGLSTAEAYCSVAEATTYFTKGGKADAWDAVEDKEAALRLATRYLTQTYRGKWAGMRYKSSQALDWPRDGVPWDDDPSGQYPIAPLPVPLREACAELALRSGGGTTDLMADLDRETLSETVDVISVTYAPGAARQTQYAAVDSLLRPLFGGGGGWSMAMERA